MTLDYGRRGQPPPAMFFYHTHAVRHRSQSHKKCKPREQLKHHQQSKIHKQNTRRRRRNWNWKEQTRRTKAIWIVYCERHSREIFVHSNFQTYVYVVVFFAVAGDSSCCRKRVTPQQHFRIDRLLLLFNTYHYCCSVAAFHCLCVCVWRKERKEHKERNVVMVEKCRCVQQQHPRSCYTQTHLLENDMAAGRRYIRGIRQRNEKKKYPNLWRALWLYNKLHVVSTSPRGVHTNIWKTKHNTCTREYGKLLATVCNTEWVRAFVVVQSLRVTPNKT